MKAFSLCLLCTCVMAQTRAQNVYYVAMAGGSGTRLWPLSRDAYPKQFLKLNGKTTLLEDTLERAHEVSNDSKFWVVTTRTYYTLVRDQVGEKIDRVLVEPDMRNTGPAILLTCMTIAHDDPDAVVVFLPSDHYIAPVEKFRGALRVAVDYCKTHDDIVLLGIQPTYPATGYGYLQYVKDDISADAKSVLKFHEKPTLEKAQEYINSGCTLWNAGIFCTKVRVFIKNFQQYAPDIFAGMQAYLDSKGSYSTIPNISVDFAVMEKSKNVRVVPLQVTWSDVGNLREFLSVQNACGVKHSHLLELADAHNNLVSCVAPDRQVVLLGVNNLCVVDTGDALLVSNKACVEKVKDAQAELKKTGKKCV